METRKVTIISTKGQTKTTIETQASTLGELKVDMSAAGINYDDMAFYEGVSKTGLVNDDTILPSNLPFKGTVTNDLLIMLTVKDKKITSGAMTRAEAYAAVKSGNLQHAVVAKFGKNFTQCSTDDLVAFLSKQAPAKTNAPTASVVTTRAEAYDAIKAGNLGEAVRKAYGKNYTNCATDVLLSFVNGKASAEQPTKATVKSAPKAANASKELKSPFTDAEIAVMRKNVLNH